MWRDEIKAYQVDKSIRLVAWLWHEALKARNLSLHTRKSTLLFSPWPFWDCQSVLDWGWWELKISMEKEKRLGTCCCRKQMITLNASWACTLNCICDSGVGKEEERMEEETPQERTEALGGTKNSSSGRYLSNCWSWQPPGSKLLQVHPPVDSLCDLRGEARQWITQRAPSAQFYWEGHLQFLRPSFNHMRGRTAALAKGDSTTPKSYHWFSSRAALTSFVEHLIILHTRSWAARYFLISCCLIKYLITHLIDKESDWETRRTQEVLFNVFIELSDFLKIM